MGTEIDSVIAALEVELDQAEQDDCMYWKSERCNRWIKQLPGAWTGRWANLKVSSDSGGEVYRIEFITHVKATLAYLEVRRGQAETKTAWWPWSFKALQKRGDQPPPGTDEPIDAEFTDVQTPSRQRKLSKPKIVK